MPDHLKVASWLAFVRFVVGQTLGGFLWWKASGLPPGHVADGYVLLCLAGVCVAVSTLRVVVFAGAFRCWEWTRRLGLGLAVFDCANLVFFPLSTALGLQGFVAYRHSETLHYFRRSGHPSTA